jgi:hypothetical protein
MAAAAGENDSSVKDRHANLSQSDKLSAFRCLLHTIQKSQDDGRLLMTQQFVQVAIGRAVCRAPADSS